MAVKLSCKPGYLGMYKRVTYLKRVLFGSCGETNLYITTIMCIRIFIISANYRLIIIDVYTFQYATPTVVSIFRLFRS